MPCDTVRSTITEPGDTGHLESRKAKILAKESLDFFARIAVLCSKHGFRGLFRNPRTKNGHFFCEDYKGCSKWKDLNGSSICF